MYGKYYKPLITKVINIEMDHILLWRWLLLLWVNIGLGLISKETGSSI